MPQINPTREATSTTAPKRMDVFALNEYTKGGEEKASWLRVGVAFENKDGKGYTLELTALPVNGKLVMRIHEPKQEG